AGNGKIAIAAFRFRFAPPPAGNGAGGDDALTVNPDHSVGAGHDQAQQNAGNCDSQDWRGQRERNQTPGGVARRECCRYVGYDRKGRNHGQYDESGHHGEQNTVYK
ncbi:hypothetical protein, partial [Novosphingobium sp. HII-3]|uniref:hypothetical protein n=1 Tax=Novosphingobium sp. HII-3 TaxID=2075565 RepID=UPI00351387E2